MILDERHDGLIHRNTQVRLCGISTLGSLEKLHHDCAVRRRQCVCLNNIRLLVLLKRGLVQDLNKTGDALLKS
jgi:hypothetical protein